MVTLYRYNSEIGTFEIREVQYGRYELWIENEKIGDYVDPELAADDIARFNTGYNEWDRFENEMSGHPLSLYEWTKVEEETPPEE